SWVGLWGSRGRRGMGFLFMLRLLGVVAVLLIQQSLQLMHQVCREWRVGRSPPGALHEFSQAVRRRAGFIWPARLQLQETGEGQIGRPRPFKSELVEWYAHAKGRRRLLIVPEAEVGDGQLTEKHPIFGEQTAGCFLSAERQTIGRSVAAGQLNYRHDGLDEL